MIDNGVDAMKNALYDFQVLIARRFEMNPEKEAKKISIPDTSASFTKFGHTQGSSCKTSYEDPTRLPVCCVCTPPPVLIEKNRNP